MYIVMERKLAKVLCTAVFFQCLKLSTSWWIWSDSQPSLNLTTIQPCVCLTTQGVTNSESPPTSNPKIECTPMCSVGSIVGAVIAGALFGSVVLATVFVCIHRRFSFCPRQKKEHIPVFRMHDGLILESPEEFGKDSPVYDDITDETQTGHSPQYLHHPGDSEGKEHFNESGSEKLNARTSDDYDHTRPVTIVNDKLNIVSIEMKCKEKPDHADLANGLFQEKTESLQTQQHREKSEKETCPESAELDRIATEDYDQTGSATVVKNGHEMSNDGKNDETFFETGSNVLPECRMSRDSERVQSSQYFSLEAQ